MRLPIAIEHNDKIYDEVVLKDITAGVIADTRRIMDAGNPYRAMMAMIGGCIESISSETNIQAIKAIVGKMPYKSADYCICQILVNESGDDGIEGIYKCPLCGKDIYCEKKEELDTRDHIKELAIIYCEDNTEFEINLDKPVTIPAQEVEIDCVSSITMRYPTLNDCATSFDRYGARDDVRLQLAICLEAITKINGQEISSKWKNRYGMMVMESLVRKDSKKMEAELLRYGMKTDVIKRCNCGKEFEVSLNTSNFFVSALR